MIRDFGVESLKIKASNTPDRIPLLERYGFTKSDTFRPGQGYYERAATRHFDEKKGLAYCGLACCVCPDNCTGCRNEGCREKDWCKSFQCCKEKKLNGCWQCGSFACDNSMLNKPRIRAFAEFIRERGEQELIQALKKREEEGILYHYPGRLTGDYDQLNTREEIFEMLLR